MIKLAYFVKHTMHTGIIAFFGTMLILIAIVTCQSLERRFMPVIQDMELHPQGDEMTFTVKGEKTRPCKFKELRVLVKNNGLYEKGNVIFLADRAPVTRGLGYQSFGTWKIIPTGNMVKIEAVHDCHPFWDSITEIGEFATKETKNGQN